jgi:hypothetical protein
MKRMLTLMVFLAIIGSPEFARGQHVIAGVPVYCSDFRGFPVFLISNPNLQDVGMATLGPSGEPVMILNPIIMNSLAPELQLFWYAHECAHHALGHVANRTPFNEAEADCWAVVTGRDQGWFPPQAFQGLISILGNNPGSAWGHLPGPKRIRNMMRCYSGQ